MTGRTGGELWAARAGASDGATPYDVSWEFVEDAGRDQRPALAAARAAADFSLEWARAAVERGEGWIPTADGRLVRGRLPETGGLVFVEEPRVVGRPLRPASRAPVQGSASAVGAASSGSVCGGMLECAHYVSCTGTMLVRARVGLTEYSAAARVVVDDGSGGGGGGARLRLRPVRDGLVAPLGLGDDQIEVELFWDGDSSQQANRVIDLAVDRVENTGGHAHSGGPAGTLSAARVRTGASGRAVVTFRAPEASGTVRLRAVADRGLEGGTGDQRWRGRTAGASGGWKHRPDWSDWHPSVQPLGITRDATVAPCTGRVACGSGTRIQRSAGFASTWSPVFVGSRG